MKTKYKSIFNLIEIFRNSNKSKESFQIEKTHCSQKHIHDFYCDAEKPTVTI